MRQIQRHVRTRRGWICCVYGMSRRLHRTKLRNVRITLSLFFAVFLNSFSTLLVDSSQSLDTVGYALRNVTKWIRYFRRAAYGCLVAGQSPLARACTVDCTPALSVTQKRRCSCGVLLMALCKCYMPLPSRFFINKGRKGRSLRHGCRGRTPLERTTELPCFVSFTFSTIL